MRIDAVDLQLQRCKTLLQLRSEPSVASAEIQNALASPQIRSRDVHPRIESGTFPRMPLRRRWVAKVHAATLPWRAFRSDAAVRNVQSRYTQPMSEASSITFASNGEQIAGALAVPAAASPERVGGVVVIQEWWGLTPHICDIASRWGAAGFVALAPDLYRGEVAADAERAQKLMTELPRERALADIAAAIATVRAHPRCNGKVVLTGYCMGGSLSLRAACEVRGLVGIVPFYGMPGPAEWQNVEAPVQLHVATRDEWVTPAAARGLQATLQGLGKTCDVFEYEADHAFCNDTRPRVYQAAEAALAWQRAVAFAQQQTA